MMCSPDIRQEGVSKASSKQVWIGYVPVDNPNALFLNDSQKVIAWSLFVITYARICV